jgi:hypothetical protein
MIQIVRKFTNISTIISKHKSKIMRLVYLKVHPDLFHNFKDAKVIN